MHYLLDEQRSMHDGSYVQCTPVVYNGSLHRACIMYYIIVYTTCVHISSMDQVVHVLRVSESLYVSYTVGCVCWLPFWRNILGHSQ